MGLVKWLFSPFTVNIRTQGTRAYVILRESIPFEGCLVNQDEEVEGKGGGWATKTCRWGVPVNQTQTLHIESDGVHILWDDGHEGHYPHWYLRAACQCADCLEGAGHNKMWFFESIPHDVQALDWMPVGQYAVRFLWSDGHDTGIYAYDTLRQLCRCPVCLARAITARDFAQEGC